MKYTVVMTGFGLIVAATMVVQSQAPPQVIPHDPAWAFPITEKQLPAEDATPKTNGLAKPQGTIVAKGKSATCTIKVGDETTDKLNYYVMTGKSSDVYLAPKWNVDRVMVKLNDIKKGAASPPAPGPMPVAAKGLRKK